MSIQKIIAFLIVFVLFQTANAQVLVTSKTKPSRFAIPFTLTEYNNISIQAILNKTDTVHLMFHTASSSITLTEEASKKLRSIRFNETVDSVKSWGNQANTSRFSADNSVQIGEMVWAKVPIWENVNSGKFTDGKFGPDLFKDKVIEIDFDNSFIYLYDDLPKSVIDYEKLPLTQKSGLLFVAASCSIGDSSFTNQFLLHTGYSGAILFDDQFAADNQLGEKLTIIGEKILKDSYGNVVKTKQAILPAFHLQSNTLRKVPVGFFEGAIGRQKMSIVGGDILKRFNLIIDAQRANIYLHANKWALTEFSKI